MYLVHASGIAYDNTYKSINNDVVGNIGFVNFDNIVLTHLVTSVIFVCACTGGWLLFVCVDLQASESCETLSP